MTTVQKDGRTNWEIDRYTRQSDPYEQLCFFVGHTTEMYMESTMTLSKIFSIPEEFSETSVVYTATYFLKILGCSRWFCIPHPHLRQCIALFAVAEGWLLLDIGWFVLFLDICQLFMWLVCFIMTKWGWGHHTLDKCRKPTEDIWKLF